MNNMNNMNDMNDTDERLLNSTEAAEFLNLKRHTLAKWRVEGKGPRYIKMGEGKTSPIMYTRAALTQWLDDHTVGGGEDGPVV